MVLFRKTCFALTLAFLCSSAWPSAFAFDPFKFPGKGSQKKFNEAMASYTEGVEFVKSGKNQEAISSYKKAIAIYPFSGTFYYNLGRAYSRQKNYPGAIASYKQAIKVAPDMDMAYCNVSEMFFRTKDFRAAEEYARKATEIDPREPSGFINLAQAEVELRKVKEAQKHLQRAQELPGGTEYQQDILLIRNKAQSMNSKTAGN